MTLSPSQLDVCRWSACGPLRTLTAVSLCRESADCDACRVPARRPGNFHLRPQMKATKAKGPNATPYGSFFALRTPGPAGHLETPRRIEATVHSTRPRFALALGPADQRGRGIARPAPPSAPPVRWVTLSPSGPPGRGSDACRTHERCCIEVVCFGDFHLDQQMKVTRPPGRDPAGNADHQKAPIQDERNVPNEPQADTRTRVCCVAGGAQRNGPLT